MRIYSKKWSDYYPFGLTMAGISSKAAGGVENKKKYQQYELNSDFDINLYESFYRSHDPQLGRWWQIDPKPADFESPYAAMGNNPIKNIDILGDTVYSRHASYDQTIMGNTATQLNLKKGQVNPLKIDKETGELSLDSKAYKKLSKAQQAILAPLKGMIDSKENFGLNVVSKDEIVNPIPGATVKVTTEEGEKEYKGGVPLLGYGGGLTKGKTYNTDLGKETIEIYIQSETKAETSTGMNGQKIANYNYIIQAHEFGHAYYRYVLGVPYQGCKAVDVENDVRSNLKLPLRAYDKDGVHDYRQ